MIQSEHVDREELLALLQNEKETERTRAIGQHLHECESCRRKLDKLAAHSEVWHKTPELLNEPSGFQLRSDAGELDTLDRPRNNPGGMKVENESWEYPIDGLLDPPHHPEMLGRLGKYEIERIIGRGGMGIVFKAHDAELNRPLAIKALAPHLANHGTARQRFAQEARAAAGVIHPNVIAVHGVSNDGKLPFIVMPYVAGMSLQSLIEKNGPLSEIEIVRIGLQIAAGLTAAHSQGLVHRDIKPANILVEEGVNRVLITDFGLARAEDDASLTRTGWLTGTPNYMSPEQTKGQRIDHRSDLFSLGSLFYFLATGRLPFRAESPLGVLNRIQTEEPTPVRHVNRQISKTLAEIIEMLLAKPTEERFQSAAQLHEILEQHLAYLHQPDVSKPPKIRETPKRTSPFWKNAVALATLCAAAIAAVPFFPTIFGEHNRLGNLERTPSEVNATSLQQNSQNLLVANGLANPKRPFEAPLVEPPIVEPMLIANPETPVQNLFLSVFEDQKNQVKLVDKDWDFSFEHEEEVCVDDEKETENHFESGMQFHNSGQYAKAIKAFREAAKSPGQQGISTYNIGCGHALLGQKEKALVALQQAFEYGFDDLEQFEEDEDLESLRSTAKFKSLMKSLRLRERANELIDEAKNANSGENFAEATMLCKKAYQLNPEYDYAALMLGYALHMNGNHDEAMPYHVQASKSKTDPVTSAIGYYNICCVFSIKDDKEKAVEAFQNSIAAGLAKHLSFEHMEEDEDLDNLREYRPFKKSYRKLQLKMRHGHGTKYILTQDKIRISTSNFVDIPDNKGNLPISGKWCACVENNEVQLQLIRTDANNDWKWLYVANHKPNDFEPALIEGKQSYQWKMSSGTIKFRGEFDDEIGEGTFEFVGNEEFRDQLNSDGVETIPDSLLFRFFFEIDAKDKFLNNLKQLKVLGLQPKTSQKLALENVKFQFVKQYQDLGFNVDKQLKFVLWRVKPEDLNAYVDQKLDLKEHEEFIQKRVPAKLITNYRELKLDPVRLRDFVVSRVKPKQILAYQKAGFDLQEVKEFVNRRVPARLLEEYKGKGLSPEDHEEFIIQRVRPELLMQYEEAGLDLIENRRLIQRRVPANRVVLFQKAGLNVKKYQDFIHSNVEPSLIQRYVEQGLTPKKYRYFLKRKVSPRLLNNYIDAELNPEKYSSFLKSNVPPSLIKAYQSEGLDPMKYRRSLIRGIKPQDVEKKNEKGC